MVKQINPAFKAPLCFIKCADWLHEDNNMPIVPLPKREDWEGEADDNGLPKDCDLHLKMLEEAKSKLYALWTQQINDGVYDGTEAEAKPTEEKQPDAEEIDMAEIARRQKQKEEQEDAPTDSVIVDKTPEDKDEEVHPQVSKAIEGVSLAKPKPSIDDAHPVVRLREAIEDIARGCVGPGTDSNSEERMDRLEAKIDQCIMDIRSLVEFQRVAEPKLSLFEKMKGMFS